jgi:hypothetical protein
MNEVNSKNHFSLLPEKYLRPYEPDFITFDELEIEMEKIKQEIKKFADSL